MDDKQMPKAMQTRDLPLISPTGMSYNIHLWRNILTSKARKLSLLSAQRQLSIARSSQSISTVRSILTASKRFSHFSSLSLSSTNPSTTIKAALTV